MVPDAFRGVPQSYLARTASRACPHHPGIRQTRLRALRWKVTADAGCWLSPRSSRRGDMEPMVSLDTSAAELAVREALTRSWPDLAAEDAVHLDQLAIVAARAAAPALLDVATAQTRAIAERCEAKAKDAAADRKHWLGLAAGLRMATVKLVALSALAEQLARGTTP